ncbi:hypothetical protein DSCA_20070 [Desulfosarcina alkanivorans]|uniref:NodB homology domain-containing protein n=1 Tax=Desulfosarcina alkanivorans TaxID=571177 RepID=A0A5K7YTT7_9BACT|nr:hypothetical protein DSCA_20070 [Desulfosarcina alkanivorans]
MRFLKKKFRIVDISRLDQSEYFQANNKDCIALTFDDGYRDVYSQAFPILKKYNVPATVFLATGYINTLRLLWYDRLSWILYKTISIPDIKKLAKYEIHPKIAHDVCSFFSEKPSNSLNILRRIAAQLKKFKTKEQNFILESLANACNIEEWPGSNERTMLSWEEVSQMAMHGVSFGGHTVSHPNLNTMEHTDIRNEIITSKLEIEAQTQKPVTVFAYPYGGKEYYNENVVRLVKEAGYKYACTTNVGFETFPIKRPLTMKRKGAPNSPYLFF